MPVHKIVLPGLVALGVGLLLLVTGGGFSPWAASPGLGTSVVYLPWISRGAAGLIPTATSTPSPTPTPTPTATPTSQFRWAVECVDCPVMVTGFNERALRLDKDGHPHAVYGGNHLYYAWHDGLTWHREVVDGERDVGAGAALALQPDNDSPHIVYYDELNDSLKHAHRVGSAWMIQAIPGGALPAALAVDNQGRAHVVYRDLGGLVLARWAGSSWVTQTVDADDDIGRSVSLALDSLGHEHIGYLAASAQRYAHWTGSSWITQTVETCYAKGGCGYTSLALDSQNRPHLSYEDDDLKHARWTGTAWITETVDASGLRGLGTSIALDRQDRPHIAYLNLEGALHYARWDGTAWQKEFVGSEWGGVASLSLALNSGGQPFVLYLNGLSPAPYSDRPSHQIRLASWTGSGWEMQVVEQTGGVGLSSSLKLDSSGQPHVSYYDILMEHLKYAYRSASGWLTETVDADNAVGEFTSLGLDSHDRPHIAYYDRLDTAPRYTYWTGSVWYAPTQFFGSGAGRYTSLALDDQDRPHISFQGGNIWLGYLSWVSPTWRFQEVARPGGWDSCLALDREGKPYIGYRQDWWFGDRPAGLYLAHWTGSEWVTETVDSSGDVGYQTSLALDSDGHAHISYVERVYLGGLGRRSRVEGGGWYRLRYAEWTGTRWITEAVASDPDWDVGLGNSLALDSQGRPQITYYDQGRDAIMYAWRTEGGWRAEAAIPGMGIRWRPVTSLSLRLDGADLPHFAYYDQLTGSLMYAVRLP